MNEIKYVLEKFVDYLVLLNCKVPCSKACFKYSSTAACCPCGKVQIKKWYYGVYLFEESHVSFNSIYELKGLWEEHA